MFTKIERSLLRRGLKAGIIAGSFLLLEWPSAASAGTITYSVALPVSPTAQGCTVRGSATLDDGYMNTGDETDASLKVAQTPTPPTPTPTSGGSGQGVHTRIPIGSADNKPFSIPPFSLAMHLTDSKINKFDRFFVLAKEILVLSAEIFDTSRRRGSEDYYHTCPVSFTIEITKEPNTTIKIDAPPNWKKVTPKDLQKTLSDRASLYADAEKFLAESEKNYANALLK